MPTADPRTERSFCRICQGFCAVEVEIADDRIVAVRGDKSDPLTRGYACFKGLQAAEQHHGPGRLRRALRRNDGGGLDPLPTETALDEIAARLKQIVGEHGPESVALFLGTQALFNSLSPPFVYAFAEALGTPRLFGTMTIDQSAKWIADGRLGRFDAGGQPFGDAGVWLLFGSNPLVSVSGGPGLSGFAAHSPLKSLKDAKARGLKLIVVDPRRTETARFADLHLQARPGQDAALAAGLLRLIFENDWHDAAFCARHVNGVDRLKAAVAPFTAARVAALADVPEDDLRAAGRLFAHEARRGMAGSGTGPDMGPHSNLAEHLIAALNAVCGRFLRQGEPVPNPGVLAPSRVRREEAVAPEREWEGGARSAVHGLGRMRGQMMSAVLADEILDAGERRIRALICVGGNPAAALPGQGRALEALRSLELLVTVDPRLSRTAELAHYIIPPRLQYERPDHTGGLEALFPAPYANYTPALIAPPAESDVVDDWYVLWRIAREMGLGLRWNGVDVPMDSPPTTDDLLALFAQTARMPLAQVKAAGRGRIYPAPEIQVQPPRPGAGRFDLLAADVAAELAALAREAPPSEGFRLIVRRQREVMNSAMTDFEAVRARRSEPAAYLHPLAMARLGLTTGDRALIRSSVGEIEAEVASDADLREDVVSIAHCWDVGPSRAATSALVDPSRDLQAINRMPVMTAIPISMEPVGRDSAQDVANPG